MTATLKFDVCDVDGEGEVLGEGIEDQYQLEDVEVCPSLLFSPLICLAGRGSRLHVAGQQFGLGGVPWPVGGCFAVSTSLTQFLAQGLGSSTEMVKKYSLGLDSLQAAVDAVMELLAMGPCENSGSVPGANRLPVFPPPHATPLDDARSHAANLCGTFLGDRRIFCRAGFMMGKSGVTLKIAIRSADPELRSLLVNAIR
jgi:hypothetical protein